MIRTPHRPGFTLIELLVAMALAIVILALGVAVSQSKAFDSYKVVGSADRLSQWLLIAKNKALRDKAPRGIRLIVGTDNTVREVAFIEQPDPIPSNGPMLSGGRLIFYYPAYVDDNRMANTYTASQDPPFPAPQTGAPDAAAPRPTDRRVYLAGLTAAQQSDFLLTVQAGDLISIPEYRSMLRLGTPATFTSVATDSPGGATIQLNVTAESLPDFGKSVYTFHNSSRLTPAMGTATFHPSIPASRLNTGTVATTAFSLVRKARPLLGEPTQQLPSGMAVDLRPSGPANTVPFYSLNPPPADVADATIRDILFAPSGEVIGATESLTALLIRDANLPVTANPLSNAADFEAAGQMILICIYNRTGAIGTQPLNPPPAADPYSFAKDGLNTGL